MKQLTDRHSIPGVAALDQLPCAASEVVSIRAVPTGQLDSDSIGRAQAPVGTPDIGPGSRESDGAFLPVQSGNTQSLQFALEDLLEAESTRGSKS